MSDSNDTVLMSIKDVSKVYGTGDVAVHALRDASLDIHEGELLVIIGPSGSGKTTFLNMITEMIPGDNQIVTMGFLNMIGAMDRPTSGSVHFRDEELTSATDRQLTFFRRDHIGFIFQFFNLVSSLTAKENVQVVCEIARDPLDPVEALTKVGLGDRVNHFPSQLSGGQQQRVAVARALVAQPDIFLCDEPTGALDSETSKQVLELLVKLNKGLKKTIIIVTHDTNIPKIANRVALIKDGRIDSVQVNAGPLDPSELDW